MSINPREIELRNFMESPLRIGWEAVARDYSSAAGRRESRLFFREDRSLLRRPGQFLALGFQQFVEIVNKPGSLSGLVGQMTARDRLDRVDGTTSHPMLHLEALWARILFCHTSPKPTYKHLPRLDCNLNTGEEQARGTRMIKARTWSFTIERIRRR
jgi:hypothetical protein